MKIIFEIHFSYPNKRIISSGNATNIKRISRESSPNRNSESHTIVNEYSPKKEPLFIKSLKHYLCSFVRRSPSIKKCIFICEITPDSKIPLRDEFNKKLSEKVAGSIAKEVAVMARRRFKNPERFA